MHVSTARVALAAPLLRLLSALLLALACASGAEPAARAYVWQRSWGGALRGSLEAHHSAFASLDLLAGELAWRNGRLCAEQVSPDWPLTSRLGTPVGLVLRVGACQSRWTPDSPETRRVIEAFGSALAQAEAAGAQVSELQCDFDAAVSQLPDYTRLLHALRLSFPGRRLTATTLPAWLRSPDFRGLLAELDAFVLQVHSLEKPVSPETAYSLCPPLQARAWIQEASRLGKPFRVALPSYGYLLGFDDEGRFRRLQAEGSPPPNPSITRWVPVMADPFEIAALVRELRDRPPPCLEALSWFRLPAGDEERTWSWETLALVMQGKAPSPALFATVRPTAEGSLLVMLENRGSWNGRLQRIVIDTKDATLLASDALMGWRVERREAHRLSLVPPSGHAELEPGAALTVAWLRLPLEASPELRLE
jgi:hypothetical protein